MEFGVFGSMFDFDRDGHLDAFEMAAECMFLDDLEKEEERERRSSWDDDDWDSDNDDDW